MRLLVAAVPRVLLPGGRLEVRLERSVWQAPLAEARSSGLAAFYRAGRVGAWPEVGTFAAIVGRRSEGDRLYLRLRGLRRVRAVTTPAEAAVPIQVATDPEDPDGGSAGPSVADLQILLRRYHAAIVEHGERADIGVELPTEPEVAAYRVASLLRVSEPERQFLLEAETTHDRLIRVMAVLRRETDLLRRTMGPKGA